nr:hypothetical protein [Tanacetum cinerariifolium]
MPFEVNQCTSGFYGLDEPCVNPYLDKFFIVFINDILIYSKSKEDHEVHFEVGVGAAEEGEVVFLVSKYEFWLQELRFLRHVVTTDTSGTRANTSGTGGNYSGQQRVVNCFNYKGEGHMTRQYPKLKRKRDATWFRDKVLLVEAQGKGKVLNEEELEFLEDPCITEGPVTWSVITHNADYQANDLDAYDFDCDDISIAKAILMANLSCYGSDVLSEEKEAKNIDNKIALEKKVKELDNIVHKKSQSAQTVHMLTKPQVFYDNNLKQALGFQNPFYLKKAQKIRTMLYDGSVIAKETNVILILDSEETMMLEEESRSKMHLKQRDPIVLEKKVNIKPINYDELNQLLEDFVNLQPQQAEFPQLDSGLIVLVFKQGNDPIDIINNMMSFLSADVISRYPTTNNQLRNSSNPKKQATINDGRVFYNQYRGDKFLWLLVLLGPTHQEKIEAILGNKGLLFVTTVKEKDTCPNSAHNLKRNEMMLGLRIKCYCTAKVALMVNLSHYGLDVLAEDQMVLEKKVNTTPIDYAILNHLSQDFKKQFVPLTKLSVEQAFWSQNSMNSSYPNPFCRPIKVEVPKELPKVSMNSMNSSYPNPFCRPIKVEVPKELPKVSMASKTKSWLWHRRLSHLKFHTINHLARHDLVGGLPKLKFEKDHMCSACAMGKSKKKPYKPKSEDTNKEKLYLLHMDICGPMCVASVNGKKIDNETEFVNQTLRDYNEKIGISYETSISRYPHQNGVVERRNRTLIEAACTMLIYAKALLSLWAEAVATTCYTQNRSIIRLRHGKTPYKLLHDKLANLSFFYVSGALCYPKNNSENLRKLKPKADIGIFIGYAPTEKAFRIYNRRTRRIIETIQVDFNELTTMSSKHSSLEPILHEMNPAIISSGLVPNHPPLAPNSQTLLETQSLVISNDVEEDNHDLNVAHMNNDPFFGILILENNSESSSSDVIPTIVHTAAPNSEHEVVPRPDKVMVISLKWIFKDSFSLVARLDAIRIFFAFAVHMNMIVYQMDLKTAFFNDILCEEVYISQPDGFVYQDNPNHVYKLKKALYGLKQVPCAAEPQKAKTKYKKKTHELVTPSKSKSALAAKAKGLAVLSEVALTKAEQIKLSTKRSNKDFHMSHASGSGNGVNIQSKVLDEQQQKVTGTNQGAGVRPERVPTPLEFKLTKEEEENKEGKDEDMEGEEEQDEKDDLYRDFDQRVSALETEIFEFRQTNQFVDVVSSIIGIVDNYISSKMKDAVDVAIQLQTNKLREEVLKNFSIRSTNQPRTSYGVATSLSEFELKKILIDKMEENKSINRSDIQQNLNNSLVESYNSEKDIITSYGDVVTLKRGKEAESSKQLTHKESKSTSSLKGASKSQLKSLGTSAYAEEHGQKVDDLDEHSHQEFNTRDDVIPVQETQEDASTCKSVMELEYHLGKVFKATNDQLNWHNPEGKPYLHNLSKPLSLILNERGLQVIPLDYIINNDLEYLKGRRSSQKYTTFVTKMKAADYG